MPVTRIQQSDADDIVDIWQAAAPAMRLLYGDHAIPDWTRAMAEKRWRMIRDLPGYRGGIFRTAGGAARGFAITTPRRHPLHPGRTVESASLLIVRPLSAANERATIKALLTAWFTEAQADGVDLLAGAFGLNGSVVMNGILDNMTATNGVASWDTSNGWRHYVITPAEGLLGLTGVP